MKDTIPMWPVQKEGFKDGKGFPSGTVTFPDLATSPDCEMIASGVNQKQPNAVAIGRQGNFLHWGFSAAPDHMTEEAKLVFVNAIHYIKKFEGQAPVVRKVDRLVTRPMLDSFMWTISDEGFAATQSVFGKNSQSNSTGSSERMKLLKRFIHDSIIEEFQEDWAGYASYFDSNRPYLFPAETGSHLEDDHAWQVLVVDDDAKSLGISNFDPAILEKCILLLESGKQTELADRTLRRYTNETFSKPSEWRNWFDSNRTQIHFSEFGGFKFLVFPSSVNVPHVREEPQSDRSAPSPVALKTSIEHLGERKYRVTVSLVLSEGWHIYAGLPENSAYSETNVDIVKKDGVVAKEFSKPEPSSHPSEVDVLIYAGTTNFKQTIELHSDEVKSVDFKVSYQACNKEQCIQPVLKTITLKIPNRH